MNLPNLHDETKADVIFYKKSGDGFLLLLKYTTGEKMHSTVDKSVVEMDNPGAGKRWGRGVGGGREGRGCVGAAGIKKRSGGAVRAGVWGDAPAEVIAAHRRRI